MESVFISFMIHHTFSVEHLCLVTWQLVQLFDFQSFSLQEFAGEGLRTLALAYKDLHEDELEAWMEKLLFTSTVIENREDQLAALYEQIEQNLQVTFTSFCLVS